ncbi:hypothetical protein M3O96_14995 [Aquiflexum sp. TKW24L]|uniref:hypothetical protein n=1 Tax=Aquiflexum sp. TKW24L TaxID=2942212 RepID=UPI0020BFEAFD|nr:hypothetical protein [Aquiflexum sp. TKW24L]MCL6260407.1 hypothetical protein [Aquiflexum sp. TKW24L]
MSKKLFLLCPMIHGEMYLKERFGGDSFFMTSLGSVFDFSLDAYADSLIHLLIQEDVTEIFQVHDIESPILNGIVNNGDFPISPYHQFLHSLYKKNYNEIVQDPNKIASLALIHMKHQANHIFQHAKLSPIIIENKIEVYGILSQISKRKSIQFDLKMAFQKL